MTAVPICDDAIRRQILRQPWSPHLEARQIAEPLTYMVRQLAIAVSSILVMIHSSRWGVEAETPVPSPFDALSKVLGWWSKIVMKLARD